MSNALVNTWAPAAILGIGLILVQGVDRQQAVPLAQPLETAIDSTTMGIAGVDLQLSMEEQVAAGVDNYLLRNYPLSDGRDVNLYVGYYEQQTRGHSIHSPKNCLPGGGWEALTSTVRPVANGSGDSVIVNQYILQNGTDRVLVLYWYQGRGRVASNEYWVKWDLLRDSALRRRSEEALVRIVVPINSGEDEAFELAATMAAEIIPEVTRALPM